MTATVQRRIHALVDRLHPRASRVARAQFVSASRQWTRQQMIDFFGNDFAMQLQPGFQNAQLLATLPRSAFALPNFQQFASELRGVEEVVRWPLYSYKAYPAGGSVQLIFFDQAEGQATNGRLDTNMAAQGQLPGNQMVLVQGIKVNPIPAGADVFVDTTIAAVALKEWYDVLHNGWLEISISNKDYMVGAPLTMFPAGFGLGAQVTAGAAAATTRNVGVVQNGSPDNRANFILDPPLGLLPTRPFAAKLRWNAVKAVTTAGRIGVIFDGWILRSVQ